MSWWSISPDMDTIALVSDDPVILYRSDPRRMRLYLRCADLGDGFKVLGNEGGQWAIWADYK